MLLIFFFSPVFSACLLQNIGRMDLKLYSAGVNVVLLLFASGQQRCCQMAGTGNGHCFRRGVVWIRGKVSRSSLLLPLQTIKHLFLAVQGYPHWKGSFSVSTESSLKSACNYMCASLCQFTNISNACLAIYLFTALPLLLL